MKQRFVLFHPVRHHEAISRSLLQFIPNSGGFVEVVNLEFDFSDDVADAEELLSG